MGKQWRSSQGGPETCPSGFPTKGANRGTSNVATSKFSAAGASALTYIKSCQACAQGFGVSAQDLSDTDELEVVSNIYSTIECANRCVGICVAYEYHRISRSCRTKRSYSSTEPQRDPRWASCIKDPTFSPTSRPTVPTSTPTLRPTSLSPTSAPTALYVQMAFNTNACTTGATEIHNVSTCQLATHYFGYSWTGNSLNRDDHPKGCFATKQQLGYFNYHSVGIALESL